MIRSLTPLIVIALALPCLAEEPSAEAGFVDLLAGDALNTTWRGYRQESSPADWVIEQGVLTHRGAGGGDLVTRQGYADFDLRFEWKVGKHGNSGVHYRVSEDTRLVYENAPEYQVLDPRYPDATDWNGPASLYAMYPVPRSHSRPAGEWNTGRIVARGDSITHWLNGEKVVEAVVGSDLWNERIEASKFAKLPHFAKNRSGRIALQDHNTPVWYRKVRIKRLAAE